MTKLYVSTLCVCLSLVTAGCSKKLDGPTPKLTADSGSSPIDPAIVCRAQRSTELTLKGLGLSPIPINVPHHPAIAIPSVSLLHGQELDGSTADGVSVLYGGDPTTPSNLDLLAWDSQMQMRLTVNQSVRYGDTTGELPQGLYDLTVDNPDRHSASSKTALAVVDKPAIDHITPPLLCLEQGARDLTLAGSMFLNIDGTLPSVMIDGAMGDLSAASLDDCTHIAFDARDASYCNQARLSLERAALAEGVHGLVLENPDPAACHSEESIQLRIVAAPSIDAVEPEAICNLDQASQIVIRGHGFLQVDDAKPSVRLAGQSVDVASLDGCEDLETTGLSVKRCEHITLAVDPTQYAVGDVAVEVQNPDPAGCNASATGVLRIVGKPAISSIAPSDLCSDLVTTFTVRGSGFDRGARASIDGTDAMVSFVSDSEVSVTTPPLAAGTHAFTLSNAGSCEVTQAAALTVEASPIVFFVDPPSIYNAMPVDITVFTSGLAANATKVELVRDQERHELTFMHASPNKIIAHVNTGLAAGAWDVVVTNAAGCPGTLPGGLIVDDMLSAALVSSIKPSFAYTGADTAVTISGAGLAPVPRVYLTPSSGSGTALALRAVEVKSGGGSLTAVIPSGLSAGTYDLIVVNPDGKVDALTNGVTITAAKPPVITNVTPASLAANASATLTLSGSDFRSNLTVELDCRNSDASRITVPTTEQSPSNGGTNVDVSVTLSSSVGAGAVCLVRLTNQDGASFEYSAFSVTNASLNLATWSAAPDLTTARRALSLAAGRPTFASRYVYAIGGDQGVANDPNGRGATVYDSVESSQVDVFGAMSSWSTQRNHLPGARTGAGAVTVGRFVYLLGGRDGSAVHAELYRASILDPLAGPTIDDLDAVLGDGQGLSKGLYYYRVAALMRGDNAANPGGEMLAGELLPVQLPERSEKIALTVKWSAVSGAHGYRVYRSPTPGAAADSLQMIGEITCGSDPNASCDCGADPSKCRFQDSGATPDASKTPLPAGSLGVWHAVAGARCSSADCSLGTAREGFAIATVQDPNDASKWFVYAFGGRDSAGAYLDTYEVATVTIAADGGQTVSDFVPGSDTLEVPRADHGVWVMSKQNSRIIASSGSPNDVWIYVGGGRTTAGATNTTLEAGKLGSNGVLNAFVSTDPLKGALVGFATGASNDQLYTFGGIAGTADGTSAQLCDGMGSCGPLPDLKAGAFNALGSATTKRMYGAATQESAFFFVAGGHDGQNAISSTLTTVQ